MMALFFSLVVVAEKLLCTTTGYSHVNHDGWKRQHNHGEPADCVFCCVLVFAFAVGCRLVVEVVISSFKSHTER